jgi:hypothetical protein
MNQPPSDQLQRWARAWKVAGAYLERERAERLRSMTDDDARKAIADLFFGDPTPVREPRESGLIEQQRLFRKLR